MKSVLEEGTIIQYNVWVVTGVQERNLSWDGDSDLR